MIVEGYHIPVLLKESVDGLEIKPDGVYVDVTFGGGGHSREILSRLGAEGHLYSFDQDEDAEQNIVSDERFTFVRSNFRYLKNWMRYYGIEEIDGLLADLGVSSHHFDDESRGFSFRFDAPLDMRMNKRSGMTAADIVNNYSEEQLSDIFYIYGELKNARRIASAIVKARAGKRIETTSDLLQVLGINEDNGLWKKDAAKLFQALRIEVNHEMDALKEMLNGARDLICEGGRLSVITYHSLEDRLVKNMMKAGNVEGKVKQDFFGRTESPFRQIGGKVIVPDEEEQVRNPRSRSAKLRIGEKVKEMGKKKDDIELEIQEAVVEEKADQTTSSKADQTTPGPSYSGGEKDALEDVKEQTKKTIQMIKEQAKEEDPKLTPTLTLRTILGGDFLTADMVRRQIWLFLLMVVFTIVYVAFRYQCQQDLIAIDKLEKEVLDAKYKALSCSSTLTEKCRESKVLEALKQNKDSVLHVADQPPYIIYIDE